jgi:uncharacterized protein (TIGR02421 family)
MTQAQRPRSRELLEDVGKTLASLPARSNLLDELSWPREAEERFFAGGAASLPEVRYDIDKTGLDSENEALGAAAARIQGDDPVAAWLRATLLGQLDKNRLLLAVGSPEFGRISREIYGGAKTRFFGLSATNLDLATHLTDRLAIHGWDEAKDAPSAPMDARAFAEELTRRIGKHRPTIDLSVVVDEDCTSKAIAGMKRVRVRADATFAAWEADGLFCHEVETHAFSAHNGAAQPLAPFLKSGGPRSTPTQEGLAVFAELYNRSLASPRLARLAMRVRLVAMAEDGASFLDLYRALVDAGSAPRDAYLDAARICRGGMVEGGAPFTKDACYLAGLLHVYAFLSVFVRGGFRDECELLLAGRIALDDVLALVELRAMGLLERPKHRPRWLERWNTLLPYFAFTSFVEGLDVAPIEAHYREVIARAEARTPVSAESGRSGG